MIKLVKFRHLIFSVCIYLAIKSFLLFQNEIISNIVNINKNKNSNNNVQNELFSIDDILISVKTTSKFYSTRLKYIHATWYQYARNQTYLVTDSFDEDINKLFDNKLIKTECKGSHGIRDLCCKLANELNLFHTLNKHYKWFCHVDDDNYINIPNLVQLLSNYDYKKPFYLGKLSWSLPVKRNNKYKTPYESSFYFGTLGAGVCLSKETMNLIKNELNPEKFGNSCTTFHIADDMYLGYLLEWVHKIKLTQIKKFNSHLEIKQFENLENLRSQVTLGFGHSYGKYYDSKCNCTKSILVVPKIKNIFSNSNDTYRMQTIHCALFPEFKNCKDLLINSLKT